MFPGVTFSFPQLPRDMRAACLKLFTDFYGIIRQNNENCTGWCQYMPHKDVKRWEDDILGLMLAAKDKH